MHTPDFFRSKTRFVPGATRHYRIFFPLGSDNILVIIVRITKDFNIYIYYTSKYIHQSLFLCRNNSGKNRYISLKN